VLSTPRLGLHNKDYFFSNRSYHSRSSRKGNLEAHNFQIPRVPRRSQEIHGSTTRRRAKRAPVKYHGSLSLPLSLSQSFRSRNTTFTSVPILTLQTKYRVCEISHSHLRRPLLLPQPHSHSHFHPHPHPHPTGAPPRAHYPRVRVANSTRREQSLSARFQRRRTSDRLAVFPDVNLVLTCIQTNPHQSRFVSLDPHRRHRAGSLANPLWKRALTHIGAFRFHRV